MAARIHVYTLSHLTNSPLSSHLQCLASPLLLAHPFPFLLSSSCTNHHHHHTPFSSTALHFERNGVVWWERQREGQRGRGEGGRERMERGRCEGGGAAQGARDESGHVRATVVSDAEVPSGKFEKADSACTSSHEIAACLGRRRREEGDTAQPRCSSSLTSSSDLCRSMVTVDCVRR